MRIDMKIKNPPSKRIGDAERNMKMLKQLSVLALAALVLESQILAEVPGARLLATGAITVNGHQVPESSVLFHGDLVGVGPGSRAVIQEQGLAAYMEPG